MDVEIEEDTFVISTNDYTINILKDERNYTELANALKFFGFDKFEIRKKEKALSQEENILRLNKFFDNQVKIK